MFTTLMTYWQRIAQLIYDALLPHLPSELAAVLALLWPAYLVLLVLFAITALLAWLDHRDLTRRLNRRLAQLHADLDKEGADH